MNGSDYALSDESGQVEVAFDDKMEAPVDSGMVKRH